MRGRKGTDANLSNAPAFVMTEQEKLQMFLDFGCVPRSIVHLGVRNKISDQDFVSAHAGLFRTEPQYGKLSESGWFKLLSTVGLEALGLAVEYENVITEFKKSDVRIMVSSLIQLLPLDAKNVLEHDSALMSINEKEFSVCSPFQDGSWHKQMLPADYWVTKKCKAILFRVVGTP